MDPYRIQLTPSGLVERFFAEITQKRIRRGVFRSVLELIDAIDAFIEAYNANPKAFKWKKTADQVLEALAPLYDLQPPMLPYRECANAGVRLTRHNIIPSPKVHRNSWNTE